MEHEDTIEVTDEMIQAGAAAWLEYVDSDDPLEYKLSIAYRAMAAVAMRSSVVVPDDKRFCCESCSQALERAKERHNG